METATRGSMLRFSSSATRRRQAFTPAQSGVVLGWLLTAALFALASRVMEQQLPAAAMLVVMGSALGYYVAVVTLELFKDSRRLFELILDSSKVTLFAIDKRTGKRETRQVLLNDAGLAEYYKLKQAPSLVLYGAQTQLEIPLWSFGEKAEEEIIAFLRKHNVSIANLPHKYRRRADD